MDNLWFDCKRMKALYNRITSPAVQQGVAWIIILGSLIGWPVSAFTVAKGEPPILLAISWLALTFGGYGALVAAIADKHARKSNDGDTKAT
jgi:hypothetical protein